jgi:hypothetical protein
MMGNMSPRTKPRFAVAFLTAVALIGPVLLPAGVARADDATAKYDARLEGYSHKVALDANTAPSYLLLTALGVIGIAVMFKDAKRSHLD